MKTRLSRRAKRNTYFAKEKSKLRQFLNDKAKVPQYDKLINLAREVDRDFDQIQERRQIKARIASNQTMLEKNQVELDSQLQSVTSDAEAEEIKNRFRENMAIYEKSISAATAELESIELDLKIADEDPSIVEEEMA